MSPLNASAPDKETEAALFLAGNESESSYEPPSLPEDASSPVPHDASEYGRGFGDPISPQEVPQDPKARPIPKEFSSEEERQRYLRKRIRNNQAAAKSRSKKKEEERSIQERAKALEMENSTLREELQKLKVETETLKSMMLTFFKQNVAGSSS